MWSNSRASPGTARLSSPAPGPAPSPWWPRLARMCDGRPRGVALRLNHRWGDPMWSPAVFGAVHPDRDGIATAAHGGLLVLGEGGQQVARRLALPLHGF